MMYMIMMYITVHMYAGLEYRPMAFYCFWHTGWEEKRFVYLRLHKASLEFSGYLILNFSGTF